jgi:hypothetical protein
MKIRPTSPRRAALCPTPPGYRRAIVVAGPGEFDDRRAISRPEAVVDGRGDRDEGELALSIGLERQVSGFELVQTGGSPHVGRDDLPLPAERIGLRSRRGALSTLRGHGLTLCSAVLRVNAPERIRASSLDLIRRLHPKTREVAIVTGNGALDVRWEAEARRALADFPGG